MTQQQFSKLWIVGLKIQPLIIDLAQWWWPCSTIDHDLWVWHPLAVGETINVMMKINQANTRSEKQFKWSLSKFLLTHIWQLHCPYSQNFVLNRALVSDPHTPFRCVRGMGLGDETIKQSELEARLTERIGVPMSQKYTWPSIWPVVQRAKYNVRWHTRSL